MRTADPEIVCAAPVPRVRMILGWVISACLFVCSVAVLIVAIELFAGGDHRVVGGNVLFLLACLSLLVFAVYSFIDRRLGVSGVQWSIAAAVGAFLLSSYARYDAGMTLSLGHGTRYVHTTLPLLAAFFGTSLLARLGRPARPAACNCG